MSDTKLLPHQFLDTAKAVWTIVITVGNARRAKQLLDVDLLNYQKPAWLERLALDDNLVVDLCGLLSDPDPGRKGLDVDAFASRFNGDVVAAAMMAIKEAWFSFSRAEVRPVLRAIDKKIGTGIQMVVDKAAQKVLGEKTDQRLAKRIDEEFAKLDEDGDATPGSNSGN